MHGSSFFVAAVKIPSSSKLKLQRLSLFQDLSSKRAYLTTFIQSGHYLQYSCQLLQPYHRVFVWCDVWRKGRRHAGHSCAWARY
eukprot:6462359-Amphidinium_carterae.2